MRRFNRVLIAALLGLGLAGGALSVASARLGPAVESLSTVSTLSGVSVNTEIGLTFSEPMDVRSVERNFSISPAIRGTFSWAGNELLYLPSKSLPYGQTFTVRLGAAARDRTGRSLFRPYQATFTTEQPHVLYLGSQGGESGRLVLASLTGQRRVVGPNDGTVTDFSLSFDSSLAVFAKRSNPGGHPDEIWLLSLADGSTQRVFRHAGWNISQPHFSPDGRYVVFLATNVRICQQYYGCYVDRSGPIIYLLDLRARRAFPYRSATDVPITDFIDFSPAGYIAYTDLGSALTLAHPDGTGVIHIPNSGNSLEFSGFDSVGDKVAFVGQTPSSTGGDILVFIHSKYLDVSKGIYDSSSPSFSTSGSRIAYSAYRGELGIEPIYGINVYDFRSKRTEELTAEKRWSDWSASWSPDDRYIAFVRSVPQEAMYMGAGQVWVIQANGHDGHPIGGVGTNPQWVT